MQRANPNHTVQEQEAQAARDYQWLLGDEQGRRIARQIMNWSQADEAGAQKGVEEMAFDAGKRFVGLMFRAQMRKNAPEHWVRFEAEWLREENELARQAEQQKRQEPPPNPREVATGL